MGTFNQNGFDEGLTTASFAGGFEVELCPDGKSRWLMWVTQYGKRTRRRDFATASLDHGRRTAEFWYGEPIGGWRVPGEDVPQRLQPQPERTPSSPRADRRIR